VSDTTTISDRGLAVFAFAIYHQLESGNRVTRVVMDDGAGHHADGEGVDELRRAELVAVESGRVRFTEIGEAMIERLEGIRIAMSGDVA
jgi:predicted methyltransferase